MTAWSDIQKQPTDSGHFVDETDLNEIVDNDKNISERVSAQEALYSLSPVPIGGIVLWFGTYANIPEGWHLCDGTHNLPDLRSRFILGIASDEDDNDLGTLGGGASHYHVNGAVAAGGSHNHAGSSVVTNYGSGTGTATSDVINNPAATTTHAHYFNPSLSTNPNHTHSLGDTGTSDMLPPHKKLYWIGKV
jgi:hypothetical protein